MNKIDHTVLYLVVKLHYIVINKIINVLHNVKYHMLCQLFQVVVMFVMMNAYMKR